MSTCHWLHRIVSVSYTHLIVTSGATINSISEELRKNNKNINIKIFSIAVARHFIKE